MYIFQYDIKYHFWHLTSDFMHHPLFFFSLLRDISMPCFGLHRKILHFAHELFFSTAFLPKRPTLNLCDPSGKPGLIECFFSSLCRSTASESQFFVGFLDASLFFTLKLSFRKQSLWFCCSIIKPTQYPQASNRLVPNVNDLFR